MIETLEEPSWIYNCHSYAWYLDNNENMYWIDSPKPFIDDVHCIPVTDEEDVVPGDIAVYYEETNGVYDYMHSAIVYDIFDEDGEKVVILDSKWGAWGAYRHYLELVPDSYISDADSDGKPDVLYYRYTQDEHFLSIDEDNGENGHTFVCTANKTVNGVHKTCSYTTECDGEFNVSSVNSSYHRVYCPDCYYSEYIDHDLYMYEDNGGDGCVIKCRDCNYMIESPESPEYDGFENGHYVSDVEGTFSFFEPHTPESYTDIDEPSHEVVCADCGYVYHEDHNYGDCYYTTNSNYHYYECEDCGYSYTESHTMNCYMTDSLLTHRVTCVDCGYTYIEPHNLTPFGDGEMCIDCGKLIGDVVIQGLPEDDTELAAYLTSLSDEELEILIASLPEDQLARVIALLPSEDKQLTE